MSIAGGYFTYILRCSDGSYYVGITNDLDRRMVEHIEGQNPDCYTFGRWHLELAYAEVYRDVNEAIAREKQLKGWSRKKKEALISGDIQSLQFYAMNSAKQDAVRQAHRDTDPSASLG